MAKCCYKRERKERSFCFDIDRRGTKWNTYLCLSLLFTENHCFPSDAIDHFENAFMFFEDSWWYFRVFRWRGRRQRCLLLPRFRGFCQYHVVNCLSHFQKVIRLADLQQPTKSRERELPADLTISIISSMVVYWVTANGRKSSSRPSLPYTFTSKVLCLGRIDSRLA